jgi:hypothetical protein
MDISSVTIHVPISRSECLSLAQCIRNSLLALAQTTYAKKYKSAKRSYSFDTYIFQSFAQEVRMMQSFYQLSGENVDMSVFREEIVTAQSETNELDANDANLVTFEEASKILRKSVSTIKRWKQDKRCPEIFKKIGAAWYIDKLKLQQVT